MNLIEEMRTLIRDHDESNDRLSDLWTWLPSYYLTMRAHGDYNFEFMPPAHDILLEACHIMNMVLRDQGDLAFYLGEAVTDFSKVDYECMCGEIHDHDNEPHEDFNTWDQEKLDWMTQRYIDNIRF